METQTDSFELELAKAASEYYADPLGFVLCMFPWGSGPLANHSGPDKWQAEFLDDLGKQVRARGFDGVTPVMPVRMTTASGHGIGKSVLVAWIVLWILSTRPHSKGTITANTFQQLSTRTWSTIQTWAKRCLTGRWFEVTNDRIYHRQFKESWFCSAQSCREENSEAFAGQHAADSTSFYIFDEASAIPEKIWEVALGGLTDGEPMFFSFGNATRSQGSFYNVTFGEGRKRWITRSIDSRNCKFSNKELIAEWIADRGEDSDFVRVRVKGVPPRADDSQFIDMDRILAAQRREVAVLDDEPLICGVDLSWGGNDKNVIRFRCGNDARSIPPIKIPGEKTRDSSVMVVKLGDILTGTHGPMKKKIHTMFLDSAGISGAIGGRMRQLGFKNVIEINFGADSMDPKYANQRAFMWGRMKEWLLNGAIDKDTALETDLSAPGYILDSRVRVQLEAKKDMRKRGLDSPDDADALALTFSQTVAPPRRESTPYTKPVSCWS